MQASSAAAGDDHCGSHHLGLHPSGPHGGPLWEPMCYAQIGGLAVATFITLLLCRCFTASLCWI